MSQTNMTESLQSTLQQMGAHSRAPTILCIHLVTRSTLNSRIITLTSRHTFSSGSIGQVSPLDVGTYIKVLPVHCSITSNFIITESLLGAMCIAFRVLDIWQITLVFKLARLLIEIICS